MRIGKPNDIVLIAIIGEVPINGVSIEGVPIE